MAKTHRLRHRARGSFAGFGDEQFCPDPIERAAICSSRIVRNHPLPDGNKRTGYECMLEMLARAGFDWVQPEDDPGSDAVVIDGLAAGPSRRTTSSTGSGSGSRRRRPRKTSGTSRSAEHADEAAGQPRAASASRAGDRCGSAPRRGRQTAAPGNTPRARARAAR